MAFPAVMMADRRQQCASISRLLLLHSLSGGRRQSWTERQTETPTQCATITIYACVLFWEEGKGSAGRRHAMQMNHMDRSEDIW